MPARFKNPDAQLLGNLGCVLGGHERARKLHPDRRAEISKHAANTRWSSQQASKKSASITRGKSKAA